MFDRVIKGAGAALGAVLVVLVAAAGAGAQPNVLVMDGAGVLRIDSTSGARTVVSTNASPAGAPTLAGVNGIGLDGSGRILATVQRAGPAGEILRVDPSSGIRSLVTSNTTPAGAPLLGQPTGVVEEADGELLVSDTSNDQIVRVDPSTGVRTLVSSNASPVGGPSFVNPFGITLDGLGNILVADLTNGVIRVDPTTGVRTQVSANGAPVDTPNFGSPIGLVVGPGGQIFVADDNGFGGAGGVISVDPVTGDRTAVSENAGPVGAPNFAFPNSLAFEPGGDLLVLNANAFGDALGGVIRVDPATGARTALSENAAPALAPFFSHPLNLAIDAIAPQTTITGGPAASSEDDTPTFSFGSSEPGSTFACAVDSVPAGACSSPFTTGALAAGNHVFSVRATDAAGNSDATPATRAATVTTAAGPGPKPRLRLADLPPPKLGKIGNVEPATGKVFVAVPGQASAARAGRAAQKGLHFVPLTEARQIPVGSFLDARKGTVRVRTATGSKQTATQDGRFAGGVMQLLQSRVRSAKGLTELRLTGSSFKPCKTAGKRASIARRRSRRSIRSLRGNAHGKFRTHGHDASATIRGTIWTTTDRCDGTLVKVTRGVVAVRDFRRKRTISVGTGKSYLARAR